jgi:membrane associated rhomboid family serine protease
MDAPINNHLALTRACRRVLRPMLSAPLVLSYLTVSWALFIALAEPTDLGFAVREEQIRSFQYHIPDLTDNTTRLITALGTAVFLNRDSTQLVAVTLLVLLFGVSFERREGSGRTLFVYYLSAIAGALAAGSLLYALRLIPGFAHHPALEFAWERAWSGGSAGCFGLMGGLAARSSRPRLLLAIILVAETANGGLILRSYTPAFHISALFAGYVVTRCLPTLPTPACGRSEWTNAPIAD